MESNPESRQYHAIWKRLKTDHIVSVTAPRPLHSRIIKAVIKEKWMDLGYKIQLDGKVAVLSHTRKNAILTFYLDLKPEILDLRSKKSITPGDF